MGYGGEGIRDTGICSYQAQDDWRGEGGSSPDHEAPHEINSIINLFCIWEEHFLHCCLVLWSNLPCDVSVSSTYLQCDEN